MSRIQSKITHHITNQEKLNLEEEKAINRCQHLNGTDAGILSHVS